jgi:GTP cyclohydrolase I
MKEELIKQILQNIGEDPKREGLQDTPKRVVKMWKEIFRGYDLSQKPQITSFKNGKDGIVYDQMIVDKGTFHSHCEHHMVPFFGEYIFAYIPSQNGNILGLSKVARVIDFHCAKLQVQERLVHDIVEDIWKSLCDNGTEPLGMALMMKGEHLCKTMRGVKKKGQMVTTKLKGVFFNTEVREEFLNHCL